MVRRNLVPGLPRICLDRLVERHALHRLVVEADDQVAGRTPARCAGVSSIGDDLDEPVLHADLDAQAAELAARADAISR